MRLAHLSDLHFFRFPSFAGIWGKRLLGLANLYGKGRIHHFDAQVAASAIEAVLEARPDAVLITGDLTALGSPAEFETARQALEPLLSRLPTIIIPGNHDYYTLRAARTHRIERYFGPWMRSPDAAQGTPTWPALHLFEEVAVLGLNPCRFSLGADGKVLDEQLEALERMLERPEVAPRFKVLMIHYPLLNRLGMPTRKFWRRLHNRDALLSLLERRPVDLIVHGHDHLRYLNHLHQGAHTTYLYNAGSAAFNHGFEYPIPASFNVYEISAGALARVEHHDRRPQGWIKTYDGAPLEQRWSVAELGGY